MASDTPKLKKAEFAQVLHENPQLPQEPDDSYLSRIMDTAIPMALRILPAIGGSIIGGLGGSIPGLIAGGAAGSGFGEGLAQAYETSRGLREDFNPQQIAMQSFLGGIPLGAGKIASTGRLAAQSGLLGGGSTIGTSLAETGEMPSVPQFLMGTGLGTVMGAGAGKLAQRPMRNIAAGDPPLQGMMDFEDVTGAMPSQLRRGIEPQYAVPPQQQGLNVQPNPAQEMGLSSLQQNTPIPLSAEDLSSIRVRTDIKGGVLRLEPTPKMLAERTGLEMADVQLRKAAKLTTKQRKEQAKLTNVIQQSNRRLNHLMVEHLKWEQGVKGAKPLSEKVQRGLQKKIDDATTKLEGRIEHVEVASDLPADARVTETGVYGTPISAEGPPVAHYSGPTRSDTGEWIEPVKTYQTRVPVPGDPDYAGPVLNIRTDKQPSLFKEPIKRGKSPFFGKAEQKVQQKAATEVTPIEADGFKNIRGHDSSDIAKARRDAGLGGDGAPPPRSDELNDLAGRGIEGLAWYKELGAKGIAAIYGINHPITRLYTRILAATSPSRAVAPDNINAAAQVTERIRMNPDEAILAPLGITSAAGAKKNIQRVLDDFYENTGLTSRKLEARKVGGFDAALTDSLDIAAGRKPTGGILTRMEAVIDRHMMAVYGFNPSKQGVLKNLYHGGAKNPKQLAKFWRDVFTDDNGNFQEKLWKRHTKPAASTTKSHGKIVATKGTKDRVGTLYDFIAGDIEMKAMSAADNIKVIDGRGAERSLREVIGRQLDVHEYQSMVWNGVRTKSQAGGAYENPARLIREQYSDPNIPLPMGERTTKLAEGVKRIPTLSKLDEMPASGYAGEGRSASDAGARTGDVLGMRITGATAPDRQLVDEVVNAALSPKARAGKKDGWVNYRIGYDKGSEAYSATSIKPKDPSRYKASQSGKRKEAFRKHELVYDEPLQGTGKPKEIKKILNNFLYTNTHILTQMTEARPSAQRPFLRVKYSPPKKGVTGRLQFEVAREGTGSYTYKE